MKLPPDADRNVRLAVMEGFLLEQVPSVSSVASAMQVDVGEVESAFGRLAAGRAIVLVPGSHDILMAAPFAGKQTDFRVLVAGRSYYANCVWDALGISAMLAGARRSADAEIRTRCRDCGEPLSLAVRSGNVTAEPPDPVVHFSVPAAHWWDDIVFT